MKGSGTSRPRLAALVEGSPAGASFLVPAELCMPVFRHASSNGKSLRVLFAILWFSSETLRGGVRARFRVSGSEARIASGYEVYQKDRPVLDVIESLRGEACLLADGRRIRIFEEIEILEEEGRWLEWVFTPEFADLFLSPPTYAIVSIQELAVLKTGLDFFLYLQIRRIWKMRRRTVTIRADDLGSATGSGVGEPKRLWERVRRAAPRFEEMLGDRVLVHSVRDPGSRSQREVRIELRSG